MKKINITLLLIVLMSMVGVNSFAHDFEVKNEDGVTIYYKFINYAEVGVTYKGTSVANADYSGNVVIPETVMYDGKSYNVKAICLNAFRNCEELTNVTIPSTVTTIEYGAFGNCKKLSSITFPEGLTSMGKELFSGCTNLTQMVWKAKNYTTSLYSDDPFNGVRIQITDLIIGNEVKTIPAYLCEYMSSLTTIVIPNSVVTIGGSAFESCTGITSVEFGNGLKTIGNSAFDGCTGITSLNIPNSVTSIGAEAFRNCSGIVSVNIPNRITSISNSVFSGCSKLSSIEIPNSVTTIGYHAFASCSSLKTISIPNSVTTIGTSSYGTFNGSNNVTTVYSYIKTPTSNTGAYLGFSKTAYSNAILYVPYGKSELYRATTGWKDFSNIIELEQKYTINYIVDNNKYKSEEIEVGTSLVPEEYPIKEGYTFSGWSKIPETMPGYDVEVKGSFSVNKYKLTYIVDGSEYKTYEIEFGSALTPETEPTKELYTFSGWSEIPETMPAHDVVITGTFALNKYKLTYNVDGEVYKTYDIRYGSTLTPIIPAKEGCVFSGWSEIPETMPAHDVEVTGSFSVNKYKLTYNVNGELYKTFDIDYGTEITPEAEPEKEESVFSGWSDIPETMPAHDVTISGFFTQSKVEVKGDVNGDGKVTANDIVYLAYFILHGTFPESQQQANAFAIEMGMDTE